MALGGAAANLSGDVTSYATAGFFPDTQKKEFGRLQE